MEEPAAATTVPDDGATAGLPPAEEKETGAEKRLSMPSRPNTAARHAKRLTLNFPIALPLNLRPDQSSPAGTPATESPRMMSPAQFVSEVSTPSEEVYEPTDLLVAIASQERKVLEIREELQRAEAELSSLKRQWVRSERQKKQTEINHHAEAMRPIRPAPDGSVEPSPRSSEDPNGTVIAATNSAPVAQIRRSKELERRNSIRTAPKGDTSISANGRRVFAGSKHTRTLSLLSPDMGVIKQSFPMQDESGQTETQATRHPRSATLPSVERADTSTAVEKPDDSMDEFSANQWRRSLPPPSSEALLRTGRQMASDLREGLWTFLEDIRQATVGEEGISATRSPTLQPPTSTSQRSRSGQRSDRSVTPVRRREQNGAVSRTNSSTSLSKEALSKKSGKNKSSSSPSPSADTEDSFWSEFGVDTPGQKLKFKKASAVNTPNGRKESEDSNNHNDHHLEAEDDWSNWDTPQPARKSHTPSSSRSTIISRNDQSPSTQLSSPRTSASFEERIFDERERYRTEKSIPWPALSKFTASQLTRTASSLMDEWEKSLTSAASSSHKADLIDSPKQKEQDDWEAF